MSYSDWFLSLSFFLYSVNWVWDIIRSDSYFSEVAFLAPLWPLFGILLLIYLRNNKFSIFFMKSAFFAACVGVSVIAFYEKFIQGAYRVTNGVSPIVFGNLSMLYSVLAFFVLLASSRNVSKNMALLLFIFILGGILTSIFTGSRGSWGCLFFVLFALIKKFKYDGCFKFKLDARSLIFIALFFAFGYLLITFSHIEDRFMMIKSDLMDYREGRVFTSLGLRFEMWRGAWIIFSQHIWFGAGESQLTFMRDQLVESGVLNRGVIREGSLVFLHLHNDIFDVAARRGLIGVLFALIMYFVPFYLFFAKYFRSTHEELRWLALSGGLIPIMYFLFGLSYTVMREPQMLAAYFLLISVIWCAIRQIEDKLRKDLN
ncbi:O-antigen ligase family protein [Halotalea alkalilenta]|uniref:O-antigen ligase family protein n=1 Tax=Halotalea alkalilenta TaxID=376489 RepID=UPI0012DFE56E|nr:O-antigen ligase family protein [Halotalea alkalilenta]